MIVEHSLEDLACEPQFQFQFSWTVVHLLRSLCDGMPWRARSRPWKSWRPHGTWHQPWPGIPCKRRPVPPKSGPENKISPGLRLIVTSLPISRSLLLPFPFAVVICLCLSRGDNPLSSEPLFRLRFVFHRSLCVVSFSVSDSPGFRVLLARSGSTVRGFGVPKAPALGPYTLLGGATTQQVPFRKSRPPSRGRLPAPMCDLWSVARR